MKYVGSKNKISKEIAPIIQKCIDDNNVEFYLEPFVGGANMIDKIKCKYRTGCDIHKELIALLEYASAENPLPKTITEQEYIRVKDNKERFHPWRIGLVGFCATFGSKYFGGYARGNDAKGNPRDIPNEAIRNLSSQVPNLKGVKFLNKNYLDLKKENIKNFVIYCDPPYANTTEYKHGDFDSIKFWDWVRDISKDNFVFISEYNAPDDFKCIWSKEVTTSLKVKEHENRTEKLFTIQ